MRLKNLWHIVCYSKRNHPLTVKCLPLHLEHVIIIVLKPFWTEWESKYTISFMQLINKVLAEGRTSVQRVHNDDLLNALSRDTNKKTPTLSSFQNISIIFLETNINITTAAITTQTLHTRSYHIVLVCWKLFDQSPWLTSVRTTYKTYSDSVFMIRKMNNLQYCYLHAIDHIINIILKQIGKMTLYCGYESGSLLTLHCESRLWISWLPFPQRAAKSIAPSVRLRGKLQPKAAKIQISFKSNIKIGNIVTKTDVVDRVPPF